MPGPCFFTTLPVKKSAIITPTKGGVMKLRHFVVPLVVVGLIITSTAFARSKIRYRNLHRLVEEKPLKVYLDAFKSDSDKISPDLFQKAVKETMLNRENEKFIITATKEEAHIAVSAGLLSYRYLEEDPPDQIIGGVSGFVLDCVVKQNYADVNVDFTVKRTSDNKRLWHRKFMTSVTHSNMPEDEAIPRVLNDCAVRFIDLCFGKPRQDNL